MHDMRRLNLACAIFQRSYIGSQVTRSLSKLLRDDIVLKNHDYKIQDVMFKKWIRTFLWK
jgi:hypothetical protein